MLLFQPLACALTYIQLCAIQGTVPHQALLSMARILEPVAISFSIFSHWAGGGGEAPLISEDMKCARGLDGTVMRLVGP